MKVFIAIAALCCMAVASPARNKTKIKIKIKIETSRLQTTLPPLELDRRPRISMWPGKVNQHNENGAWITDSDGVAGGHLQAQWGSNNWGDRKLEYCQRFWPNTTEIQASEPEEILFHAAGNTGAYPSTKPVWLCLQNKIDRRPRISMWPGKVNQHNENGIWMTDSDGAAGGHLQAQWGSNNWGDRKLEYCQRFWPDTIAIQTSAPEEILFRDRGNTGAYLSTKPVWLCVQKKIVQRRPTDRAIKKMK